MNNFEPIEAYIPQRKPIVMVSEISNVTDTEIWSKFFVSDSNIFCENGFLTESGLIENIAQTAAAMTGYNAKKNAEKVKKGFIGSVNNLVIHKLPLTNQYIETKVTVSMVVMDVTIITGYIKQNNELIAECEMKIFLEK